MNIVKLLVALAAVPVVAVYYRDDGQPIPDPGIIVLGRVDSGVEALDVPGATKVTIERVK